MFEWNEAIRKSGFQGDLHEFIPDGGEGILDVRKRAQEFLKFLVKTIVSENKEKNKWNVLIVSHGGWLRHMVVHLIEDYNCEMPAELCAAGLNNLLIDLKNGSISNFELGIDRSTTQIVSARCTKGPSADHIV